MGSMGFWRITGCTLPLLITEQLVSGIKLARLDIRYKIITSGWKWLDRFVFQGVDISMRIGALPHGKGEKNCATFAGHTTTRTQVFLPYTCLGQIGSDSHPSSANQGLILITGPTGSGKHLTLYAALHYLKQYKKYFDHRRSCRDTIRWHQSSSDQSKSSAYFATALRLVRFDPDIIMIGEIRDKETMLILPCKLLIPATFSISYATHKQLYWKLFTV